MRTFGGLFGFKRGVSSALLVALGGLGAACTPQTVSCPAASANAIWDLPAPGVANIVQRFSTHLPTSYVKAGTLGQLRVSRDGADVNDTYAADVLLLGWRVRFGDALNV